jgi:hypothetical protein
MRRFCNYFVTLFNQKKINPLSQFISQSKLKELKQQVRNKMDFYTSEDPEKLMILTLVEKEERKKRTDDQIKARAL